MYPLVSSHHVELLAPARDFETGLAAIRCGADAVYIGASQFGARSSRQLADRYRKAIRRAF